MKTKRENDRGLFWKIRKKYEILTKEDRIRLFDLLKIFVYTYHSLWRVVLSYLDIMWKGFEEGWEALVRVITMYAREENSGIIVLTYLAELFRPYPLSNNWWIWDKPLRGTRESTVVPPGRPPIDSAPKSWAELKRRKTNFPSEQTFAFPSFAFNFFHFFFFFFIYRIITNSKVKIFENNCLDTKRRLNFLHLVNIFPLTLDGEHDSFADRWWHAIARDAKIETHVRSNNFRYIEIWPLHVVDWNNEFRTWYNYNTIQRCAEKKKKKKLKRFSSN